MIPQCADQSVARVISRVTLCDAINNCILYFPLLFYQPHFRPCAAVAKRLGNSATFHGIFGNGA